jgi:uncharacterized 2Fe-2S/4Fe-4S cluster protein (DUF4445 family)
MPTITIQPFGKALAAERGAPLRDLLQGAGILLDFPCGGKGICRQCRVTIDPPSESGKGKLSDAESAGGVRLACQTVIEGDCTVTIPEARMSGKVWKLGLRDSDIGTAIGGTLRRIEVPLAAPSLDDQRSDWERLKAGLESRGIGAATPDAPSLERLSLLLRESGWAAEALCEENDFLWLGASRGEHAHGFAVDLGTTTVDIALFDLETGRRLGRRAFLNGQVAFGADVISRAQSFHSEREPVRRAALETIDEGARTLLAEAGVKPGLVVKTVVVGNPIMLHILNGIDPWQLTSVPYIPVASCSLRSAPRELGWTFQKSGYVETLPLISAYVGADTIGMIVALDLEREAKSSLNIDIGTNGEMVLARQGKLLATSTAAGPAFEGAEISCGMRAFDGAIVAVSIGGGAELSLQVVGDSQPRGICGTGLISAIAALLDRGVIDETGRLLGSGEVADPGLAARVFPLGSELAFALSDDRRVYISQNDVRKLQLAKGAVRTGIDTLLDVTGMPCESLDAVRLAGNFGAGLDARAAMRIGLIPPMDLEKVEVVGNAALKGAILVLLSREQWRRSESAARNALFIELGGKPEFQARFAEAMMFSS